MNRKASFADGTSVMILIFKTEQTEGIIITINTKIMKTSDVVVPTEGRKSGRVDC